MTDELVYRTKPYAHQLDFLKRTWKKPAWGMFCEMGVGKSKMVIDTFINLYLAGEIDTILYVAKKGELANFSTYELPTHKPENVDMLSYVYEGYTATRHIKSIQSILKPASELRMLSMNVESIRSKTPHEIALAFVRSSKKVMIIVDESTVLKDPKSKQTKAMMELRKYANYVRIMTGTVIPHGPVDVYSQAKFLGRGLIGYNSLTAFKAQYLIQELQFAGNRKFMATVGSKNLEDLQDRMRTFATVLMKEDCLDLPEKIYTKRAVPLTPEQIKLYKELVDFAFTTLPDGEVVEVVNALSLMSKCHQIVCGQLKTDDGYQLIPNNRYEATHDCVEEVLSSGSDKKVVLWSHFRAASLGLKEYLKSKKVGLVHMEGGLSIEERQKRIARFKTEADCQLFLANPQSSGFGITLTESHHAAYYSNSDNFEHRLQSEDRIHRIGQNKVCLYTDFHSPGTVEDAILNRNLMKGITRKKVLMKEELLELIELK
jgi:SNF2 family DNA or RNA helicase